MDDASSRVAGVVVVEPVSLIVGALAVCAGEAGKAAVSEAVKDAYKSLKTAVRTCLSGRASGEVALDRYVQLPHQWAGALEAELVDVGAAEDAGIVAAARRVMELADPQGYATGKYQVDVRGGQGVQLGDHNSQTNTFGAPPATT
jgi:hypothetical protein